MRISHFKVKQKSLYQSSRYFRSSIETALSVLPCKVHLVELSVQLQVQGKLVPHPGHQELPHLELQQIYVGIL